MPQSLRGLAPRQPRSPDLRVVRTFDATPDDGPTRTERPAEGRFAMVPDVVLATGNAHAIAVYAILAKHANQDGYCWPSLPTIGTAVGLSKPTVEKAIALLVAAGAIRKERRYAHGMLQSNGYFLLYSAQYRQASTLPTQASTLPMVGKEIASGRQSPCLELEPREREENDDARACALVRAFVVAVVGKEPRSIGAKDLATAKELIDVGARPEEMPEIVAWFKHDPYWTDGFTFGHLRSQYVKWRTRTGGGGGNGAPSLRPTDYGFFGTTGWAEFKAAVRRHEIPGLTPEMVEGPS